MPTPGARRSVRVDDDPRLAGLAARLPPAATDDALLLGFDGDVLELRAPDEAVGRGVRVDLGSIHVPSGGAVRRQPLIRACGKAARRAVDACAGLGGDSFLLAAAGMRVPGPKTADTPAS